MCMILLADQNKVPRILCNHGLEDTAHWLRAAGYDVYIPGVKLSPFELYRLAQRDERVLVLCKDDVDYSTSDSNSVVVIESSLVFEQIKQIGKFLNIDWLYRPLSRCMLCNTELVPLNINQWISLPESIQAQTVTSHGCTSCKRIYWAGDEVNRMVDQLESFKSLDW